MNIIAQFSSVVMDELTGFTEYMFEYLLSRLRTDADMKPVMRCTMNPAVDSWVRKWVEHYLYPEEHPEAGIPDPSKQGKVRWIYRNGEDIYWSDSREECLEKYGKRDEEGNLYPRGDRRQIKPLSFAFISANAYDNPYIDDNYIAFLEGLPPIEKALLLHGSWNVRVQTDSFFDRSTCEELVVAPPRSDFTKIVRAYDFASTKPHQGNPYPDYFCSALMGKLKTGNYVVLEVVRTFLSFGEWEEHILGNAYRDGSDVEIILPLDPNAASKYATSILVRSIAEHGYIAKMKRSSQGKLDAFRPLAASAEVNAVHFVKGCASDLWNKIENDNDFLYNELEQFDGKRSTSAKKDDMVDALSLAFSTLAQRVNLPNISSAIVNANLAQPNLFHKSR